MSFNRIVYIVNPASQNGATGRAWPHVIRQLPKAETLPTRAPGDATRLAMQAAQGGADLVISVGGDGTLSEVVTGLMQVPSEQRPAVAIVPRGTGGDFRKTMGYPKNLSGIAVLLERGRTRLIDVGSVTYVDHRGDQRARHFINICSFGLGGVVDREVNRASKALGGKASFFLGSLRALRQYRNVDIELSIDGSDFVAQRVVMVAACNGRIFGGGMQAAPTADPGDGQLEILTVGDLSDFERIVRLSRIYTGSHIGLPGISYRSAKRLSARADAEVLIDLDGEQPGRLPIEIGIAHGALRFVC